MRNVPGVCVDSISHSIIRFEENRRVIYFHNPQRALYNRVQVDGCAITNGARCDNLLTSSDEHSEYFVELKGVDVKHALEQLEASIAAIGQYEDNRHAYVVSTNVVPSLSTTVQIKKKEFKKKFNAELVVKEKRIDVQLN